MHAAQVALESQSARAGRRFLISPVARDSRANIARYNLSSNKWSIVCLAVSRGRASNEARTNSQKKDPSRFFASAAPSPHARSRKWIQTRSNEASGRTSGLIPVVHSRETASRHVAIDFNSAGPARKRQLRRAIRYSRIPARRSPLSRC